MKLSPWFAMELECQIWLGSDSGADADQAKVIASKSRRLRWRCSSFRYWVRFFGVSFLLFFFLGRGSVNYVYCVEVLVVDLGLRR